MTDKEIVTVPKSHLLWILIGIVVLIIITIAVIGFFFGTLTNRATGAFSAIQKQSCPYECCNEGEFYAKFCLSDYECKNSKCLPLDSDKDGLNDIEEKQLGTNPNLFDSDADTLSDYQEIKVLGTNPLKINTDDDRYNDNVDPNPTIKNSANIVITIINKEFGIDWVSLGIAFIGGGVLSPDMTIAEPKVTIKGINNGNDYTSFLSYDIVFSIAGTEIKRIPIQKNKINADLQFTDNNNCEIKAKDIPSILINVITGQSAQWNVQIENINYEQFT